jgi:hypothetical protein
VPEERGAQREPDPAIVAALHSEKSLNVHIPFIQDSELTPELDITVLHTVGFEAFLWRPVL